ncbi:DNA polymerase III subunit beta [Burkholderia cepacia]
MQTIHFTIAQLKAAQFLAAENDLRSYFNGVYLEATPFETRLVGCDGMKIGVVRHAVENDISADTALIVPNDIIDKARVTKRDMLSAARVEIENGQYTLCVDVAGLRLPFAPVDGRFPEYRRVFPKTTSGEPGQFDPQLLVAFAKAGKTLLHKSNNPVPRLAYNGDNARVTFDNYDEFVGVIMGWRAPKNSRPAVVDWL